jgi:hypothetical protein
MPLYSPSYPDEQRDRDERMMKASETVARGARATTWFSAASILLAAASLVVSLVTLSR